MNLSRLLLSAAAFRYDDGLMPPRTTSTRHDGPSPKPIAMVHRLASHHVLPYKILLGGDECGEELR